MLVAAVGLVVGLLSLARLTSLRDLLVDRLDPAGAAAQRLRIALVDEETGARGYALGRRPTYLEPYRRGRREEERAYDALEAAPPSAPA